MQQRIASIRGFARDHALDPLVIVAGILIVAGAAKLGHGLPAIGGFFSFYPIYLTVVAAVRIGADWLAKISGAVSYF